MQCPVCEFENPDELKFCGSCGKPLQNHCSSCGFENPLGFKFCGECGVPLTSQEPSDSAPEQPSIRENTSEAERRQLTVMFCDLVDSTPLSERLDPEVLRNVLRDYQEVCSKVIGGFEGYLARYFGDGLLIYFGYPQAHEDDPQRAVRSGLGIVSAMEGLNTRLEQDQKIRLDVRVGIHTGLVVVGDMDSEEQLETMAVVGEVPNIADRLQKLAEPNTVVVSADTHRLIDGFFDFRDRGEQSLRGISHTMRVYQVLHESTARSRLEVAATRGLTPLVGREPEVGLLQRYWAQVKEGMGQVVLLNGEAGIGKSRLVEVLKEHVAHESEAWLTEFRCSPYHQNSAFYPIIDLLERVTMRFKREDSAEERLQKLEGFLVQYGFPLPETVPLFATLLSVPLSEAHSSLNLSPELQKQRTMEALLEVLLKIAIRQPVLFVMEDLHWVDPSTLDFLNLLVDQGPTAHILTLLTYRPDFEAPWAARTFTTQITLNRLHRTQVVEMVDRLTSGKELPEAVHEVVVNKTDGVPLFVEELTKMVLESGLLQEREGRYELTGPLPPLAIPTTLQDSLMARLDRLGSAKEVAQLGATFGREFSYEWLRAVSPQHEPRLQRALTQLVEAELLYQRGVLPQAIYLFKHALIQEAAYESLLVSTRQRYHVQIAQVLTEQFPETAETQPEFLAYHYTAAGLGEQAVPYWYRAGERAVERSANVEAIDHIDKGLGLLGDLPDIAGRIRQEMDLQILLGLAQRRASKNTEALDTYRRAAEIAKELRSSEDLAQAALGFEETRWRFNLPAEDAVDLLEDALNALGEENSVLRVRILGNLARAIIYRSPDRSAALIQQAVEMARRLNDPLALCETLNVSIFVHRPEQIQERIATTTEFLHLAEEIGDSERILDGNAYHLYDYLELGDIQIVDEKLDALARLTEKIPQPLYRHTLKVNQAMRALLAGQFEEGERLARLGLAIGQEIQIVNVDGTFGMQMFTIRKEQGRLREVAPILKTFVEQHNASSTWLPGLALIYAELDMSEQARETFEGLAENDFAGIPRDTLWMTCVAYLSEVCAYLKDTTRAETLYQFLLPYNGRTVVLGAAVVCYGPVSRYLGILAATMGWEEAAESHFQDALKMNTRMGARPWLAHTQHDYAAMLLERDEPGDCEKAETLLEKTQSTAWELGMANLVKKVDTLKTKHGHDEKLDRSTDTG